MLIHGTLIKTYCDEAQISLENSVKLFLVGGKNVAQDCYISIDGGNLT
jgi:hypothetical protein